MPGKFILIIIFVYFRQWVSKWSQFFRLVTAEQVEEVQTINPKGGTVTIILALRKRSRAERRLATVTDA